MTMNEHQMAINGHEWELNCHCWQLYFDRIVIRLTFALSRHVKIMMAPLDVILGLIDSYRIRRTPFWAIVEPPRSIGAQWRRELEAQKASVNGFAISLLLSQRALFQVIHGQS